MIAAVQHDAASGDASTEICLELVRALCGHSMPGVFSSAPLSPLGDIPTHFYVWVDLVTVASIRASGMSAPVAPKGLRGRLIRLLAGWTFDTMHQRVPGWCNCVLWLRSADISSLGASLLECRYGNWTTPGLDGFLPTSVFWKLGKVNWAAGGPADHTPHCAPPWTYAADPLPPILPRQGRSLMGRPIGCISTAALGTVLLIPGRFATRW